MIEGVTRALGRAIWHSTVIGLTHGRLTSLPGNMPYGEPASGLSSLVALQACQITFCKIC